MPKRKRKFPSSAVNGSTVKVSLDLTGTNLLFYNRDRSLFDMVDDPNMVALVVKAYDLAPLGKIYLQATIDPDGQMSLGKPAENQNPDW